MKPPVFTAVKPELAIDCGCSAADEPASRGSPLSLIDAFRAVEALIAGESSLMLTGVF